MWRPRRVIPSLFLGLLGGLLLFGCRAFEPESVVVNRPPQTYLIGSPAETAGAYFHFHVFWYGTDDDGYVERYVWALTDTSIQDWDTDEDEEDSRFNPALNISHLAIGNWTTRTDTVFDFRINQGSNLSRDMTLHVVAVDDRGDFDRTPARLYFFSNALGRPRVQFYRDEIAPGNEFANYDTIGFGRPLYLRWAGSTPNIAGYNPGLLAQRDTVPPIDGLLGYKWYLAGFLPSCNFGREDCWQPRYGDDATGDSLSYFDNVTALMFRNDASGAGIFARRLAAGRFELLVNAIDVAGVEVSSADRVLNIVVNYDPDTYILRDSTPPELGHNDDNLYPYYTVFHGPDAGSYHFVEHETVPDRAYVTFKALGWDDSRDLRLSPNNRMTFTGSYRGRQRVRGGGWFTFGTAGSDTNSTAEWTAADPAGISGDTLGFYVGPFEYTVFMRAVDEQGKSDGTPDSFQFVGNFPPCVQCIELGSHTSTPSYTYEDTCYHPECFAESPELQVYHFGDGRRDPNDPHHLGYLTLFPADTIWVAPDAGLVRFGAENRPVQNPDQWTAIQCWMYYYLVYLHGKDHVREYWAPGKAHERIKAWRYEINYAGDPGNVIADGGPTDNISLLTGFDVVDNNPNPLTSDLYILPDSGIWVVRIKVGVPLTLINSGPEDYWDSLLTLTGAGSPPANEEERRVWQTTAAVVRAQRIWRLTTMQFTAGTVDAIAADGSTCDWRKETNSFNYYRNTRFPQFDRDCEIRPPESGIVQLDLNYFIAYSNDGQPVTKNFTLVMYPLNALEQFTGGQNPPGWLAAKGAASGWH